MLKRKTQLITLKSGKPAKSGSLVCDIRALIEQAREHVSRSVNGTLVALYWQIGKRVHEEVLHGKRAAYGERIISTLSKQLLREYGRGYSKPNLSRMMVLHEYFPDAEIVSTLSGLLVKEHGQGFSDKNLHRMVQFYEIFLDERIVVSAIR